MSTVLIAPPTLGDLVKREFDLNYNREAVTLKAGAAYVMGAVLGRITANGVYALSPKTSTAGLEGAEIACAVLINAIPASATDSPALVLARGPVIVADNALAFDASVDAAEKALKHQQLSAHGIVVRQVA